ncbi:MAG: hypothetical protein IOD12_01950 [Silvanigrellales bacterium]|jgi:hypothetical protein|nr:hypothetical protein [Silvanigrellales bacterium]
MPYQTPRVTLETYEQELVSLVRLVTLDLQGDDDLAQTIVFTPSRERMRMSPAELIRRGFFQEAYEAARDNFFLLRKSTPENLSRAPRMLQKKGSGMAR